MRDGPTVHLVDDDPALLRSVGRLLSAAGYGVATHDCPRRFIGSFDPEQAGCVVLDRRMPEADGHAVQSWLTEKRACVPVIFLTAAGDIASSVRALKGGAVDYLTKPVDADALFTAVDRALALDQQRRRRQTDVDAMRARLNSLTPREREVLDDVVVGRLNKEIAADLDIVEKTVKVHRARAMKKMGARTLAELITIIVRHRDGV